MQKPQIVACFLVPADQDASETIHPTLCALHHPPPGFDPGLLFEGLGLFPARPNVGGEAKLGQQIAHFVVVIALIQAHPLRGCRARLRPRDRDTLDGLSGHLEVITIGALDRQADRHATAVGEHAALGAELAAVGWVPAHLFPPQGGLWSWPHPSRAIPSQSPARHRRQAGRSSTMPGRDPPPSTLGSGDARNCWSRYPSHAAHSTGIRYGARRRWHPSPSD